MRSIINWFGLYVVLCAVNVGGLDLVTSLFGGGSQSGSHHKHNISTSHSEHSIALSSFSGGSHAAASVKVFHFILTPAWGVTTRWILHFLSFSFPPQSLISSSSFAFPLKYKRPLLLSFFFSTVANNDVVTIFLATTSMQRTLMHSRNSIEHIKTKPLRCIIAVSPPSLCTMCIRCTIIVCISHRMIALPRTTDWPRRRNQACIPATNKCSPPRSPTSMVTPSCIRRALFSGSSVMHG